MDWKGFHSISFPNEWGETVSGCTVYAGLPISFHSISFPNEWGEPRIYLPGEEMVVSIQLVSPVMVQELGFLLFQSLHR